MKLNLSERIPMTGIRKYQYKFFLITVILMLTVTSCAIFKELISGGITKPTVQIESIKVKTADFTKLDLKVTLWVQNANDIDLTFTNLEYKLIFDSKVIAKGNYDQKANIPAKLKTKIELPLSVDIEYVLSMIKNFIKNQKKIDAVWQATADFESPIIGSIAVKFEDKLPIE